MSPGGREKGKFTNTWNHGEFWQQLRRLLRCAFRVSESAVLGDIFIFIFAKRDTLLSTTKNNTLAAAVVVYVVKEFMDIEK